MKKSELLKHVIPSKTVLVMSEFFFPLMVFPCNGIFSFLCEVLFLIMVFLMLPLGGVAGHLYFIVAVVCSGCHKFTCECIDHSYITLLQ